MGCKTADQIAARASSWRGYFLLLLVKREQVRSSRVGEISADEAETHDLAARWRIAKSA
jgi:site-specific recombinase XerC